jgi:hypothetical protein
MARDVRNDFDAGNIHYKGLKIGTFLGPEMATSEASAILAQKSLDLQGPSLSMARVMDLQARKIGYASCT